MVLPGDTVNGSTLYFSFVQRTHWLGLRAFETTRILVSPFTIWVAMAELHPSVYIEHLKESVFTLPNPERRSDPARISEVI